jgi:uncharacterized NAD-dependent epimerase/dehydratase family protein
MTAPSKPRAVIYCEGAFDSTNGKTAHGLLRRSERYEISSVVDSYLKGRTAGEILSGCRYDVPIVGSVKEAVKLAESAEKPVRHLIVGLAPDGGRLKESCWAHIREAVSMGLSVVSGLHDFLSDNKALAILARTRGVRLFDIRKPKESQNLHFFSGKIEAVTAPRVAVLGTDSAVGKRTTAWMLVDKLDGAGMRAVLVGTGQTAWLQGAEHCIVFDAVVNDFVSGEIEHAVWSAWRDTSPDIIVIEGQGSLMNPAYPGGLEILAAARPSCVVLQHAPARKAYDGFPGYPIQGIEKQIEAIELVSGKPVVAVAVNSEGIPSDRISAVCDQVASTARRPAVDPLVHGVDTIAEAIRYHIRSPEGFERLH